jgi:cysteinyl-tRNA synthetase
MNLILDIRQQARADHNWPIADRIRDALNEAGIVVEDGVDGTTWRLGG